jgi:hypothetical protein
MKEIKTRSSKHNPLANKKTLLRQSSKAEQRKSSSKSAFEKKKGKRGKKICPDCDEYVPIHSQRCWNCTFLFTMNHKPKKEKVAYLGEALYAFEKVAYQRQTP